MSSPPPYTLGNETPMNPDARPLPSGWVQQYDANYKTWFYVNTNTQPPSSSWTHPAGTVLPPPGPPPNQYQGPPQPQSRSWQPQNQYCPSQGQGQWSVPQQTWCGSSPSDPGYGQQQGGWNSGGRENDREKKAGSGGLLGLFKGSGGSNHNSGYGGYGPNQGYGGGYGGGYGQQPVYAQQQPKKSGLSGGAGLALGAGAGLLGGLLVADAVEDVYDSGYDAGFDNGDDYGDGGF